MPMWRCPHCGTPQAETARCWVCRRSSTACGTCRHFRRSVAAQLGYCGLDRDRQPLAGDEIRACWEAWPAGAEPRLDPPLTIGPAAGSDDRVRRLEFVEVRAASDDPVEPGNLTTLIPATDSQAGEARWNLWGDLDR